MKIKHFSEIPKLRRMCRGNTSKATCSGDGVTSLGLLGLGDFRDLLGGDDVAVVGKVLDGLLIDSHNELVDLCFVLTGCVAEAVSGRDVKLECDLCGWCAGWSFGGS